MLNFSEKLLAWSQIHGRKDLPWQTPHTPYRVWLSEIMLQQTQVQTVIPYFLNFISQIPDIHALAAANLDEVLSLWSGLGYYSRARNLHRCAQIIVKEFSGIFPSDLKILQSLPGIGRSTAAAIASLAFNLPTAIMDGNVKRVLSRYFLIKEASNSALEKRLWLQAELCMPHDHCRDYTQAIMDMGATCCSQKNPNCLNCPLNSGCGAYQQGLVLDYPAKKIKPIRPLRQEQFLLFYTKDKEIYLEQRPEKGIWAGLWCLPSLEADACPSTFIEKNYGQAQTTVQTLMNFNHNFTHFQLAIEVKTLFMAKQANFPGRWIGAEQRPKLGLAKPISKIFDYFLKAEL